MLEEILGLLSGVGEAVGTANQVLELVNQVKNIMQNSQTTPNVFQGIPGQFTPQMQHFQAKMADPFQGQNPWLPQLQQVAQQFGNSWVPNQTYGLMGIDLTGLWCPPMNSYDQTYIRQYGPYLNIIAGVGGNPTLYGEGIFYPQQSMIQVVARSVQGFLVEARGQLFPNWTIQGILVAPNMWGMPTQMPLFIAKVA